MMTELSTLLDGLTAEQQSVVTSGARRLLVVAGAGSGKTEVVSRRIAWWLADGEVERDKVIAFTFTEKAAEELKFRIRKWIGKVTPQGEDATLGRMYIGTIHGFCLQMLQELRPDLYGMFDVLDDAGRLAMVQRWFHSHLGLSHLQTALGDGQYRTIDKFLFGYDMLNEFDLFEAEAPGRSRPEIGPGESDWIKEWNLVTDLGGGPVAEAFAVSAARYYGALHARRLLDFSTAQSELVRLLKTSPAHLDTLRGTYTHLVVDEFQDINPVQDALVRLLVGTHGTLTAVGDHRQAIYGWRGGRVEIMGTWAGELSTAADGDLITLPDNFRSTARIIRLANRWARTIRPPGNMRLSDMRHGNTHRTDDDPSHVAFHRFENRQDEAAWIAETIGRLVGLETKTGVPHDVDDARHRGIGLSDIAVLLRSTTDARTYLDALEQSGIPAVVRGGPDLFQQPEVLLLLSALAIAAGIDGFYGGYGSLADIGTRVLGTGPEPEPMLRASVRLLEAAGLPIEAGDGERLILAAREVQKRLEGTGSDRRSVGALTTNELKQWLRRTDRLRRVFPQTLYQWLASEVGVARWDAHGSRRATTAMFHLGQIANLIKGIETPGWVTPGDFKWQIIALANWGARNARSEEAPLLAQPDAVSILTIHSAKGLEFPVVFLADVAARRFPSSKARTVPSLPFDGPAAETINPASLADTDNYDAERRLMYVALTRAERYLFMSSGSSQHSRFERELRPMVADVGGLDNPPNEPVIPAHLPTESNPTFHLVTSFSDLRYYLECPHDYYLRKVLGFSPTIDQAFGYGRGVHNLMREVHLNTDEFAELANDKEALETAVQEMIDDGLFYLRYTTGEPLENMKRRAKEIVVEYVTRYAPELRELEFEPERAFETLLEEANVLVAGAIDVIRHDDPPRVALIDFKSGDPERQNENASGLDKEEMQLQISLYALAAKKELEYEPGLGIVRYLGGPIDAPDDERELVVPLDDAALQRARDRVVTAAEDIQKRQWDSGPRRGPRKPGSRSRCDECDFIHLCGRPEARHLR